VASLPDRYIDAIVGAINEKTTDAVLASHPHRSTLVVKTPFGSTISLFAFRVFDDSWLRIVLRRKTPITPQAVTERLKMAVEETGSLFETLNSGMHSPSDRPEPDALAIGWLTPMHPPTRVKIENSGGLLVASIIDSRGQILTLSPIDVSALGR
jgi:hypothetical protein